MKDIYYFLRQIHEFAGKTLYVNLLAMICMSFLEGAGILLLVPMISLMGIVDINTEELAIIQQFDFLSTIPSSIGLPIILGIFILLAIVQNLLQRRVAIKNAIVQQGFLRHLRIQTYSRLMQANWGFYLKHRKSDLINLLKKEISRTSSGINSILMFCTSLVFTLVQIGFAFILSPTLTVMVLICGLLLIYFNRKFLKQSLQLGRKNYELGRDYLAGITDHINGIKDIKSNTLEGSRIRWYQSITERMQAEQVHFTTLKMTSQLYYKIASAVLIAFFIFVAIQLLQAEGSQLMLIIIIFSRLWPRVVDIQASMERIATTIPSFQAVKHLQHECNQAIEFMSRSHEEIKPITVNEGIKCKNVYFRYESNKAGYTLRNISLFIPANKMTAFVGKSGAGKSTLIDILMGLNKPEKGEVFVDGIPLTKENLIELRQTVSYVAQDPFLFNTSIRENLLLIKPGATEQELWEALDFASAAKFVRNLVNGLDTVIGDRGMKLSGGEKQRLVLARAILRSPGILVLDEATSALDNENEGEILSSLNKLKDRMTLIVIAHRLSTVHHADQVIVLDKGEVKQMGTFRQLESDDQGILCQLLQKQTQAIR